MLDKYREFFNADKYAALSGIKIEEARPGYAVTRVTIEHHHLNGAGVIHGGLLFTLADFAVAVASNTYGKVSLSVNAGISFFAAASEGHITAEATEISRSNKLCTYDVNIRDCNGRLLANSKITSYITHNEIEF